LTPISEVLAMIKQTIQKFILALALLVSLGQCSLEETNDQIRAGYAKFKTDTLLFFDGFNMTKYSKNATQCVYKLENAIEEYIGVRGKVENANNFWEVSLAVTKQLSTTSDYIYVCYDGVEDFMLYYLYWYRDFKDVSDFGTSFFQNLLGNVINI
jgi:hypothetical protein